MGRGGSAKDISRNIDRSIVDQKGVENFSDEQLKQAGFTDVEIQTMRLNKKLKDTETKLEEDLKAREMEEANEKTQASNLSLYATQRLKRLETGGRAATMKPILSSSGAPITQNPNRKTLIGV